mmetsp:Transcript_75087/g.125123  ORF Transcript_75087/g.125123 Transcript_75087/m.125123 type:complete len:110 (+) Transcript_75087:325-654(+)
MWPSLSGQMTEKEQVSKVRGANALWYNNVRHSENTALREMTKDHCTQHRHQTAPKCRRSSTAFPHPRQEFPQKLAVFHKAAPRSSMTFLHLTDWFVDTKSTLFAEDLMA